MGKCKYLRDGIESLVSGISRLVQKCTIHEMPLNLLKLSKSSQALKFRFTARQSLNMWQTLILGPKLATMATYQTSTRRSTREFSSMGTENNGFNS